MVISMALAALLLSAGFGFAKSMLAYFVGVNGAFPWWLIAVWLATWATSTGFAFLAGNLWP